ncbi:MAG: sigma 54-interacting transcriptional regulator [Bacteroidales bacterium]
MPEILSVKQRFGIIGISAGLDRAIETAVRVAPTDLSVLVTGESGVGKENFPQILHQYSARKHQKYIAVNCGAIPEGTIDSELFGHLKGSFTGALSDRRGYFEEANGGTIFLDEIGELPLSTQVRLLRILESGEYLKVGSSEVHKTNVRVVAATNLNIPLAIEEGKFREDLYYRLNTVPIIVPPLRDRGKDVIMLFKKFSSDFAEKYRMPQIKLADDAQKMLATYRWPGNVRQLKNVTEQISIIEENRDINAEILARYLPNLSENSFALVLSSKANADGHSERDMIYNALYELRKEMNDMKQVVLELVNNNEKRQYKEHEDMSSIGAIKRLHDTGDDISLFTKPAEYSKNSVDTYVPFDDGEVNEAEYVEEEVSLSLEENEKGMIVRALSKHGGKRISSAQELGISVRTLYRKIKEYDIDL